MIFCRMSKTAVLERRRHEPRYATGYSTNNIEFVVERLFLKPESEWVEYTNHAALLWNGSFPRSLTPI